MVRGSTGVLSLTVLEGAVNGTRHQGAPQMSWIHNPEIEWQDLWGIKSTGTRLKEM